MDFSQCSIHNVQQTMKMVNNTKKQENVTSDPRGGEAVDFELIQLLKLEK